MKKILSVAIGLMAFTVAPVFAQPTPPLGQPQTGSVQPPPSFQQRLQAIQNDAGRSDAAWRESLAKFNLDFPGGTPKELVAAIEKAGGKPVNVIINKDDENAQMPPIKASEVDVPNLFKTLSDNSKKYVNNEMVRNFGFQTIDQRPTDNSLWTFYSYNKPNQQAQFSLDFPGGTPTALVKAIEKAMGKPLNVVINKEDENVELPPLKMNDVYLPQLFSALEAASRKTFAVSRPNSGFPGMYDNFTSGYGFKSSDGNSSDNSVWYFRVEKPALPPVVSTQKTVLFYSLAPYLDRGFTVDDITTAIQTGWKLAGETSTPELNYHKETKMLIAFGEPGKLQTIDNVLRTLPSSNATRVELDSMRKVIENLRIELDGLKGRSFLPSPAPYAPPAEKSGK